MPEECGESVEVIMVGSRKDALLEFCSASPFLSPVLRFWYICALLNFLCCLGIATCLGCIVKLCNELKLQN